MLISGSRAKYYDPESVRHVPQEFRKSFKVSEMWDIHREISRRVALGEKNKDIAEALGVSEVMVSYTKHSPVVEKNTDILRGAMDADTIDLGIRIQQIAPKALDLIEEALNSGTVHNEKIAGGTIIKVAERHMDRAGFAPVKKVAVATGKLTPDQIEKIKQRAISSGIVNDVRRQANEETINVTGSSGSPGE